MGLQGFSKQRRCITTKRKPGHRVIPDLIGRTFTADTPNRVYVGDITYLPCKGGKNMYLATGVGWNIGPVTLTGNLEIFFLPTLNKRIRA